MTLLQVDALGGGFASRVGRDRGELGREPGDEIGQSPLASTNLFQLFDEAGAFPVGFFEEAAKYESKAARAIIRHSPHKGCDLRQSLLRRDPPRREAPDQIGNLGFGAPVAEALQGRTVPVRSCGEMGHQPLLARPIRVLGRRRRRVCIERSKKTGNQCNDREEMVADHRYSAARRDIRPFAGS